MICRRIFAALALLCALIAPAHAQKTKAQITTEIGTLFPNNTTGAITPTGLRTVTTDIINSIMPTAPVVTGNLACFNGTTGLLQDCGKSPASFPNFCVADNTGATNAKVALQACIDAGSVVNITDGDYKITSELTLHSNLAVNMSPNVTIHQDTRGARIFYGTNLSNVAITSGNLVGEGTFCGNVGQAVTAACPSGEWTGDGGDDGHNDRAIQLNNCTNCRISRVHTKNTGTHGISIWGGNGIAIEGNFIEGTNLYSTPITAQANFQFGIGLFDHPTWGALDNLVVANNRVTGTAQAVFNGNYGVATANLSRVVNGLVAYDITGQHVWYGTSGNFALNGIYCTNIVDNCIDLQITLAGYQAYNFSATGVVADTVGSNMFVASVLDPTASARNIKFSGVGRGIGRGLAVVGPVTNLEADVQARDTSGEVIYVTGDSPKDLDITVQSTSSTIDGVLVTATNADRIRFHHPIIRQPNSSNTGRFGFLVASASANVTIFDPVIADSSGLMVNGISNSVVGGTMKVFGSAAITGASGTCVSATGAFTAWPIWAVLSCTGGNFTGAANITNPDAGSAEIPFGGYFARAGSAFNWVTGGAVTSRVRESGDALLFELASGGYRFDAAIVPSASGLTSVGSAGIGWSALVLEDGAGHRLSVVPPASGTPLWAAGSSSGTPAVTASAPLAINTTTGNITCATCTTAASGAALTKTDDTNVTLTLGGSPSTALLNAASITAGWTGQLPVARGGTGLASGTSGGIPYYSGSTTIASSAALAANQLVIGGGAGVAPSTTTTGTGVLTALGINVGSAGAPVTFNGAGGTPSSITLTNATGLPTTGLTGTLQAAQEPAHTGDVTNTAGSLALTLVAGNAGNLNSGTLLAARMPAHTGDVTSSAGSVALSLVAGNAGNLNSGTLLAARMPALTGACTTSAGAVATTCTINTTINGGAAVNTIVAGATGWVGIGLMCTASEAFCYLQQPQAGTISNLYINTNAAPGVGQTYTVTMRKNATNQTITCTISGGASTGCNDTTHSFTVAAADNVSIQIVASGGAATIGVSNFGFKLATTSP